MPALAVAGLVTTFAMLVAIYLVMVYINYGNGPVKIPAYTAEQLFADAHADDSAAMKRMIVLLQQAEFLPGYVNGAPHEFLAEYVSIPVASAYWEKLKTKQRTAATDAEHRQFEKLCAQYAHYQKRALALSQRFFSAEGLLASVLLYNIGLLHRFCDHLEESEQYLEQAVAIQEALLNPHDTHAASLAVAQLALLEVRQARREMENPAEVLQFERLHIDELQRLSRKAFREGD